jgi:phospholipid/cholesterol/gamma-HCH transport system substrate-binding protein
MIPASRTSIPVSAQVLLTNMDRLVNSVDTTALRTVVTELGTAFNQRGPDLTRLLDSSNNLLQAAEDNLPETISLLDNSAIVLDRQLAESQPLQSFTHSLNLLSQQLKQSNGDISHLLGTGPSDLEVIRDLVLNNRTDLGAVIANLATTGRMLVRHLDGIEQVFELYPALAAGGPSVVDNGIGALGQIANNVNDPPDCGDPRKGSEGYQGTTIRSPADLRPAAPNVAARCTAPASSGTNIRGSAHVPGGDPISTSGGGVAYPRATTANTVTVDTSLNAAGVLGDQAWVAVLTAGLH